MMYRALYSSLRPSATVHSATCSVVATKVKNAVRGAPFEAADASAAVAAVRAGMGETAEGYRITACACTKG